MGWRLVNVETKAFKSREKIHDFIKWFSGFPSCPVERELKPGHIKQLELALRSGKAVAFNFATVECDGKIFRGNGNHSLHAIKNVGDDIPDRLTFSLSTFQADDMNGVIDLFDQFDPPFSSRTEKDAATAYRGAMPELHGCDETNLVKISKGLAWRRRHVVKDDPISKGEVASLILEASLTPFFKWANKTINGRNGIRNPQVIASMYECFTISPEDADKFWGGISMGKDYMEDQESPAYSLAQMVDVLGDSSREGRARKNDEDIFTGSIYCKCAKAWNAFADNSRINNLKVGTEKPKQWPPFRKPKPRSEANVNPQMVAVV